MFSAAFPYFFGCIWKISGAHAHFLCCAAHAQVLGPIPSSMSSKAEKNAAKFFTGGQAMRLAWPDSHTTSKSKSAVK